MSAVLDRPKAECRVCKKPFLQFNSMQVVCGVPCAQKIPVINRRAEKAAKKLEKQQDTAKRIGLKTRSDWLKDAKYWSQRARRLEEISIGSGCMSCQRTQREVEGGEGWKPGGAWDGGHFLGKGAYPELALEPMNIWLQCKSCNAGSGKYARKAGAVNQAFRTHLIERVGIEMVEWLEGPHEPKKWTIPELQALIAELKAKCKALAL